MNLELYFQVANNLALLSWILMIIFPFKSWTARWLIGTSVTILCLCYAGLALTGFSADSLSEFSSLEGVMTLFTQPQAVLAGWVHYLAFDLMVGLYIVTKGKSYGLNRWVLTPILLFTFMLGPVGLLLFFLYRFIVTKKHINY